MDHRKGMAPGQRAVFDELMSLPVPQWPGMLASYARGAPVSALPDVAAELARSGLLTFTAAALTPAA